MVKTNNEVDESTIVHPNTQSQTELQFEVRNVTNAEMVPQSGQKRSPPPTPLEWLVSEACGPREVSSMSLVNRLPPDVPRGEAYPQEPPESSHLTKHAAPWDERKSRELVQREIHD